MIVQIDNIKEQSYVIVTYCSWKDSVYSLSKSTLKLDYEQHPERNLNKAVKELAKAYPEETFIECKSIYQMDIKGQSKADNLTEVFMTTPQGVKFLFRYSRNSGDSEQEFKDNLTIFGFTEDTSWMPYKMFHKLDTLYNVKTTTNEVFYNVYLNYKEAYQGNASFCSLENIKKIQIVLL